MEQIQFVIPDKREQLLESIGDHRVFVESTFPFVDLPIDEQSQFIADIYARIVVPMDDTIPLIDDREVFSKLYSIIDVASQISLSAKRELINLLADGSLSLYN